MWVALKLFHLITFWPSPREDFIVAEAGFLFGFGLGGFIAFFKLLKKTRPARAETSV